MDTLPGTLRAPLAKALPVFVRPIALDPAPNAVKPVSTTPLRAMSSTPWRSLFRHRRLASCVPVNPASSSVSRKSGMISKLSDSVVRPSFATMVLYPSAPTAVEAIIPFLDPTSICPALEDPKSMADLANLPRPAVDIFFPVLANFAACPALPSHPATGINPAPKATRSCVISPARPLTSGFTISKASVTADAVSVSSWLSIAIAASSTIPCGILIAPATMPLPTSVATSATFSITSGTSP